MRRDITQIAEFSHIAEVLLFGNVSNAGGLINEMNKLCADGSELRLAGYTHYALIDLSLVCSLFHLQSSVAKAVLNCQQSNMVARTISAEILYQLASTTKINEAFKQYGVSEDTSMLAVVLIRGTCLETNATNKDDTADSTDGNATKRMKLEDGSTSIASNGDDASVLASIAAIVTGDRVPQEALADAAFLSPDKVERIRKVFKLTPQEAATSSLESSVVTRIAIKDLL